MHVDCTPESVMLTMTCSELLAMEQLGQMVWATPNQDGLAHEVYIATRVKFFDDFILADSWDFCDPEGLSFSRFDEMTDEEVVQHADVVYMFEVSRRYGKEIA